MKEDRVTVGFFRVYEPEKDIQGVEDGRFEMSPERNPSGNKGIPIGNVVMQVDLVMEELLHPQKNCEELGSKERMTLEDNLSEYKEAKNAQQGKGEGIFFGEVNLNIHHCWFWILFLQEKQIKEPRITERVTTETPIPSLMVRGSK